MHHLLGMKQKPLPADFAIGRRNFSFLLQVPVLQCLVIRAKYIFFFRSAEMKSQCVLSILNVIAEGVANSSHYPVREVGSLKKYCEMNRNLRFSPGISASVHSSQHCGYAVSIPNTLKTTQITVHTTSCCSKDNLSRSSQMLHPLYQH